MDKEKVLDKIKKCLALGESANEHDITIGCFSDGSFSLDKGNGLWKMQLSRGQMLKVVGFVKKFLAMEGV